MIQPKEIIINDKEFTISKVPATVGREILFLYPVSNIPKIGDYPHSEEAMMKFMSYVAVKKPDGSLLQLSTKALIDNHVPDAITLVKLEYEMFKYNFDFFFNTDASTFYQKFEQTAMEKATKMLTGLLEQLSKMGKQH